MNKEDTKEKSIPSECNIYEGFGKDFPSSITNIIIPDTVTKIECGAFYKSSLLTNITIPNGVTEIGDYAFYKCSSLIYINSK